MEDRRARPGAPKSGGTWLFRELKRVTVAGTERNDGGQWLRRSGR